MKWKNKNRKIIGEDMDGITIKTITNIFSAMMSWFFWLIILFFVAMVFDYTTGSIAALKKRCWTSTKAREGMFHKLGIAGVLIMAVLVDILVGLAANTVIKLPFAFKGLFSPLCAVWYIITELGSVAENLCKMGVQLPKFLTKGLALLHSAADKAGDRITSENDDDKEA